MKSTKTLRARPTLESLEDRLAPAALVINGTNGNDTVSVSMDAGRIRVDKNGQPPAFYSTRTYDRIVFNGFAGNDRFINNTAVRCTAFGMTGNDTLIGGSNDDYLDGGAGSDSLYGRGGDDTLVAGWDHSFNYLDGGAGNDLMHGGWGIDWMFGRDGDDTMYGNDGDDRFDGGLGYDRAYGGSGRDVAIACKWTHNVP